MKSSCFPEMKCQKADLIDIYIKTKLLQLCTKKPVAIAFKQNTLVFTQSNGFLQIVKTVQIQWFCEDISKLFLRGYM